MDAPAWLRKLDSLAGEGEEGLSVDERGRASVLLVQYPAYQVLVLGDRQTAVAAVRNLLQQAPPLPAAPSPPAAPATIQVNIHVGKNWSFFKRDVPLLSYGRVSIQDIEAAVCVVVTGMRVSDGPMQLPADLDRLLAIKKEPRTAEVTVQPSQVLWLDAKPAGTHPGTGTSGRWLACVRDVVSDLMVAAVVQEILLHKHKKRGNWSDDVVE